MVSCTGVITVSLLLLLHGSAYSVVITYTVDDQ